MVIRWQKLLLALPHIFATTSGSDSRLVVLSLHVEGAKRPLRALPDSSATNNFIRAESLSVFPTDINIREGAGDMIVKYADGKPRRSLQRSTTFAHEFDEFYSSEEFLVIELRVSIDYDFGIPWLARRQPDIGWLTRTVCPRDIDVNAVLAFLCGTPNQWPHVAVMDPGSMAHAAREVGDGPLCAVCEHATCASLSRSLMMRPTWSCMGFHVPMSSGSRKMTMTWSSMVSHVWMSSDSPPEKMMMWLSVASHLRSSLVPAGGRAGPSRRS
ncbi:hypothetical protein PF010_g5552 [Phytophthora fragariae]|uniref:Uncharacterized protein n=2 Tax=Phytophthora fragariae TaxID=53985 RepID=A0A6G0LMZ8_9STRA|nr:hypothetical protein PF010_g5552 [Phytophthora fragariae]